MHRPEILLPSVIPEGEKLAVVGDLHGRHDLLAGLLDRLDRHLASGDRWLVFVGDFMDRGGNPRKLLQLVLDVRERYGKVTACMGNHDLALLAALGLVETPASSNWDYRYCGHYDAAVTFRSYGVPAEDADEFDPCRFCVEGDPGQCQERRQELLCQLREAMPDEHQRFLLGLPWCVEHPEFLVVHAGLLPDRPYAEQVKQLRQMDVSLNSPPWLCERYNLGVPADCRKTIVSGHVPVPRVTPHGPYIRTDTCNGLGRVLSAVLLPERQVVTSQSNVR